MAATYLLALSLLLALAVADPLVTLNHGGQLRGKQFDYNGTNIDLFLGVAYAEPPIGRRRFEKPRLVKPWKGVKEARNAGNICPQPHPHTGEYMGDEDCLFMDITVPGGVNPTKRRPVMVWIHGGGFVTGSKNGYVGATLAKHGDVIVVAINYRLGFLGFLYNGPGTGNFGLWDQRAAMLWLHDNIALFGGDADLITLFGESSGAGGISAQMMGQHNDGLFKRAIQQSGSLYVDSVWFLSERRLNNRIENIKRKENCSDAQSLYSCLRDLSVEEIAAVVPKVGEANSWHPVPDNDFFPADVVEETYSIINRFHLMAGFCEQEGAIAVFLPTISNRTQESILDGLSPNYVDMSFVDLCQRVTPLSTNLCVRSFIKAYNFDDIIDDKERGILLSFALGEFILNADTIRQLSIHSRGPKNTYAFQFSERFMPSVPLWPPAPAWMKVAASHGDEIPFVFGSVYSNEAGIIYEYLGEEITPDMLHFISALSSTSDRDKPLTDLMMTAWTNFAKTGNPNTPTPLPGGVPEWPQFNTTTNHFMEFNSTNTRVVTTPDHGGLDMILNSLFPARSAQINADSSPELSCSHADKDKDAVIG